MSDPNESLFKVGDVVYITGVACEPQKTHVIAVGKLHTTTAGGAKWRNASGQQVGPVARWSRRLLRPETPALKEQYERACLLAKVNYLEWNKLPIDTLRAVVALLPCPKENAPR